MQFSHQSRTGALVAAILSVLLCQAAPGQETKGIPPRATPADYQAHAQAGALTVAAEFTEHSVPTPEATFTTEDYVAIEVGLFGPPAARAKISYEDFSLRINGKKAALPAQGPTLVLKSLKDPEWAPPEKVESKSKTSIGGNGQSDGSLPAVVHMPFELERAMDLKVQKAALPEGERPLPAAGLIFFQYRGKSKGIRSLELIYSAPAGKASLMLHP
jgi:hypothetical protein